ncbi:unnamed protein product [Paramecium pentaurelia]|uniref:MORN repeat protein n=1 Tax=Paramecium pentaurelia TaxID=43138 RepID=A0A8S1UPE6_9CILI|nr:unnamed protein product [Paramecium pentaurelia]
MMAGIIDLCPFIKTNRGYASKFNNLIQPLSQIFKDGIQICFLKIYNRIVIQILFDSSYSIKYFRISFVFSISQILLINLQDLYRSSIWIIYLHLFSLALNNNNIFKCLFPSSYVNEIKCGVLQWKKENEINMMKIVKSMAFWNGKVLKDVGGYFLDGQKQGFWREIIHNYWSQAEVYVIGEYYKNNKVGVWKYIFHNNIIGLGQYNYQGQRIAKWIELSDRFSNRSQITYIGEYQNGQKIGLWEIWYKDYETKRNKQIGGGLYDKINSIKIGRWIENCNNFRDCSQVIYQGQYKNGKKVGRWDILYRNQQSEAFQQIIYFFGQLYIDLQMESQIYQFDQKL